MRLPAFHRAAVKDFVGCFVNFVTLVSLNKFLNIFRIFVVFASDNQVHVRRLFTFDKNTVFCRGQANLAGVGGINNRQGDLRIIQRARQLRGFQLNNFQVFRVFNNIQ